MPLHPVTATMLEANRRVGRPPLSAGTADDTRRSGMTTSRFNQTESRKDPCRKS
jgi:hypothetical protein